MWYVGLLFTILLLSVLIAAQEPPKCKDFQLKTPKFFPHRGLLSLKFGLGESNEVEVSLNGCPVDKCKIVNARHGKVNRIGSNTFVITLDKIGSKKLAEKKQKIWRYVKSKYNSLLEKITEREKTFKSKKNDKKVSRTLRKIKVSKRKVEERLKKGAAALKIMQRVNIMVHSGNKSLGLQTISFNGVPCQPPATYTQKPAANIRPMGMNKPQQQRAGGRKRQTANGKRLPVSFNYFGRNKRGSGCPKSGDSPGPISEDTFSFDAKEVEDGIDELFGAHDMGNDAAHLNGSETELQGEEKDGK